MFTWIAFFGEIPCYSRFRKKPAEFFPRPEKFVASKIVMFDKVGDAINFTAADEIFIGVKKSIEEEEVGDREREARK